jgi:hypothetical protein
VAAGVQEPGAAVTESTTAQGEVVDDETREYAVDEPCPGCNAQIRNGTLQLFFGHDVIGHRASNVLARTSRSDYRIRTVNRRTVYERVGKITYVFTSMKTVSRWTDEDLLDQRGLGRGALARIRTYAPYAVEVTFIENIKAGKSTTTCAVCGETVTGELRHVQEHRDRELAEAQR